MKDPKAVRLPSVVRINQLADCLDLPTRKIIKMCEKNGVSIVIVGKKRLRFIPRDQFLKALKDEKGGVE